MTIRTRAIPYALLLPGIAFLTLFFVVPMYYLSATSLMSGSAASGYVFRWSWHNFDDALSGNGTQLWHSFEYAGLATIVAFLIGYPLAYYIAVRAGRSKPLLLLLVIAPFFVTYLIRTLAWKTILSDSGVVVGILQFLHVMGPNDELLNTPLAVIAGLTYGFLPFMILPLFTSLDQLDTRLLEAGQDLYASPRRTFLRVTLPHSVPGILAGTLLTFIPAAGDYINAEILGSTNTRMIGNVIQAQFLNTLDFPKAASLSFVLMALILVIVIIYTRALGTEELT